MTLSSSLATQCRPVGLIATFVLSAAPVRAQENAPEIVVRADRPHPTSAPRARSVSGSVLEVERVRQPGRGAAGALREAPGVRITESGGLGAPATASIRGATAAQTPVYLNGVRLNDEIGGAANLADVPMQLIERVEVYRSHAPLTTEPLGLGAPCSSRLGSRDTLR